MRKQGGFTVIELLIVVMIIGIIAAIAIPNLLDAIERTRQKRAVGEIRTIIVAMQSFAGDYKGYPPGSDFNGVVTGIEDFNDQNGASVIVPDYMQAIPRYDGWRGSYMYYAGPDTTYSSELNRQLASHFIVYSLAADRDFGGGTEGSAPADQIAVSWCADPQVSVGLRDTTCYESDIVWGDCSFVQSPDGKQRRC